MKRRAPVLALSATLALTGCVPGWVDWITPDTARRDLPTASVDLFVDTASGKDTDEPGPGQDSGDTGDTGTFVDLDGDGFGASEDCDDTDPSTNPGMDEFPGDGVDNDCDGTVDEPVGADIVFVIDDSSSMDTYQDGLASTWASFTDPLAGTDWQLFVITTSSAEVRAHLDAGSHEKEYFEAVRAGTGGSNAERAFEQLSQALSPKGDIEPLLRDEARLSVVFMSDEPEQSKISAGALVKQALALKGPDKLRMHAIVGVGSKKCIAELGSGYDDAADRTDGTIGDICAKTYDAFLAARDWVD